MEHKPLEVGTVLVGIGMADTVQAGTVLVGIVTVDTVRVGTARVGTGLADIVHSLFEGEKSHFIKTMEAVRSGSSSRS